MIEGVTVSLLDENGAPVLDGGGVAITTLTDADGFYEFTDLLPDTYSLSVRPVDGSRLHSTARGSSRRKTPTADDLDSDADPDRGDPAFATTEPTFLESGENDPDWDAGLWRWTSIGDFAWHDENGDGLQTPGEPGINGIIVNLLDAATATSSTPPLTDTTPIRGSTAPISSTISIPASTRCSSMLVSPVLMLDGYVATGQDEGDDTPRLRHRSDQRAHRHHGAHVQRGRPHLGRRFLHPGRPRRLRLVRQQHQRYLRRRRTKIPTIPGPAGINGVTVNLLDATGAVVGTTVTADDPTTGLPGFYLFENLRPGTYEVEFVSPFGFSFSPQNQGGDDAIDSDADVDTGLTGDIALTSGQRRLHMGRRPVSLGGRRRLRLGRPQRRRDPGRR